VPIYFWAPEITVEKGGRNGTSGKRTTYVAHMPTAKQIAAKKRKDKKDAAAAAKSGSKDLVAGKAAVPHDSEDEEESEKGSETQEDDRDEDFDEEDWEQRAARHDKGIQKLELFKKTTKTKFADFVKRLDAAEKVNHRLTEENRSLARRMDDMEKRGNSILYSIVFFLTFFKTEQDEMDEAASVAPTQGANGHVAQPAVVMQNLQQLDDKD